MENKKNKDNKTKKELIEFLNRCFYVSTTSPFGDVRVSKQIVKFIKYLSK